MCIRDRATSTSSTRRFSLPVFLRKGRIGPFLAVVMSGQIIYSAFEAFKGSLMIPLQQMPVSYTHLDVYKRQSHRRIPRPVPFIVRTTTQGDVHHG